MFVCKVIGMPWKCFDIILNCDLISPKKKKKRIDLKEPNKNKNNV